MNSETFIKGLPLNSTPIQTLQDSGYFGSDQKKNLWGSHVKILNSYSPIKEYSSFKNRSKDLSLEHDSGSDSYDSRISLLDYVNFTQCDLSSDPEHCEVSKLECRSHDDFHCKNESHTLDLSKSQGYSNTSDLNAANFFTCANSSSLSITESTNYKKTASSYKTKKLDFFTVSDFKLVNSPATSTVPLVKNVNILNVQGHTKKLTKINFIHELKEINCTSIISSILSYLSSEELCRASCVSKEWRNAILDDKNAKYRRAKLIEEKTSLLVGPSKENHVGIRFGPPREHKMAFSDLTNEGNIIGSSSNSNKSSKSRFDSFLKEAKNSQRLLKCPKCSYPSKCDAKSNYICTHCSYNFCGNCFGPIFKHHTCYTLNLPKTFIDSKKSKKNLRRLLKRV